MATPFLFRRGEPIVLALVVVSGDPAGYEVRAQLKPRDSATMPGQDVEAVGEFEVEFVPAEDDQAAHWLLGLSADALDRGRYITDAQFLVDGEAVRITGPAFVELAESVSGADDVAATVGGSAIAPGEFDPSAPLEVRWVGPVGQGSPGSAIVAPPGARTFARLLGDPMENVALAELLNTKAEGIAVSAAFDAVDEALGTKADAATTAAALALKRDASTARRLATVDSLARGIAANMPLGLPVAMGAAIAESRASATTIASANYYGITSVTPADHYPHHYGLYGATWTFGGSSTVFTNLTTRLGNGTDPTANKEYQRSGVVRFATHADKFEIVAQNQNGFRVLVNGKYCKTGLYGVQATNGDTLSATRYWLFDFTGTEFAGSGLKLVEILPDVDFRFKGVRVPIGYTVQPWTQPFPLKCALHGDSMVATISDTGTDYRAALHGQMPHIVQKLTGIPDIRANNIGGAGFVADSSGTRSTFLEQAPIDFTGQKFDLVWDIGGRNDTALYGSQAAYQAIVEDWIEILLADNPDMIIVLSGPITVQNSESYQSMAAMAAIQNAKRLAAAAFPRNCAFVKTAGDAVTNDPWIFGTGKQGATAANGNADTVRGNDGTHLSVFGHQYVGVRLVNETARVLPWLASRIRDGVIAGVNDLDLAA